MNDGHFFEIHPSDTTVVWEYTNPMTRDGIKKIKVDNYPTYNGVFRAYRYAATDPGLAGHDLTPGATMTGDPPSYWTPGSLTDVQEPAVAQPSGNILDQNHPNPFNYSTTIDFGIEQPAMVTLVIYDLAGNQVKMLVHQDYSAGKFSQTWDGKNDHGMQVTSGMYIYILKANNQQLAKKMIYCN